MAAATMYVTAAGAGLKDGTTWANAMGEAEFETDLEGGAEAGDIYYIQAGTYTLDSAYDSTARDATAVAPISIIGVKAATSAEPPVLADWGSGTDRPLFACGTSYYISLGDYYKVYNCQFTGAAASLLNMGANGIVYNCKGTNSRTSTTTATVFAGASSAFISCESIGPDNTHGTAFSSINMIFCYAHDCNVCVDTSVNGKYLFCIFDTATTGLSIGTDDNITLLGNTFYNVVSCVSATDSYQIVAINNIIDTATDGFIWTTQTNQSFFAYNHQGNSVTDMWDLVEESVAPHKDMWVTSGDPDFTNEAGGDFSLEATSPCIDAGMAMTLGVG